MRTLATIGAIGAAGLSLLLVMTGVSDGVWPMLAAIFLATIARR